MLDTVKCKLNLNHQEAMPFYLQEAVAKMELTIDRLENTANLNLFNTDYLE